MTEELGQPNRGCPVGSGIRPLTMARLRRDPALRQLAEAFLRAEHALHWAAKGELDLEQARAAHRDAER